MSEAFATAAHAAFAAIDPAFFGAYTGTLSSGAAAPIDVQVFVEQAAETMGEFGEVLVGQHLITLMSAGRALAAPAAVVEADGKSYELERLLDDDGVTARWSARRV